VGGKEGSGRAGRVEVGEKGGSMQEVERKNLRSKGAWCHISVTTIPIVDE